MWLRLFMLALCGMPALRADVCDGLPASPPKQSGLSESNEPLSFKLSVKSGGPAFRITVRPLWQIKAGREIIDEARAGEIEVARCKDGKQLQVLPIAADQPLSFSYSFRVEDLNFDGYLDFSVETEFSGTGGEIRSYWVYDPRSSIFIQNEFTHELRCGSVAVTSKYGKDQPTTAPPTGIRDTASEIGGACMVAAFIDFDPDKHEIGRRYFGGAMGGCPNTGEGKGERYRVVNNRLILIHTQEFEVTCSNKPVKGVKASNCGSQGGFFQFCAVTVSDLVDGTMRVTEVRRYDAHGRRLK
jgi:hypothetical protein